MNKELKTPCTVVIVTNRTDNLFEKSLSSTQWASHVLIVDTTTDTDWKPLRKQYIFNVLAYPDNITDFSAVRNYALKQVTTPWVLFLDSDEILPIQAEQEIANIISTDLYDGMYLSRTDYFLGKAVRYGEAGTTELLRLFKVDHGKFTRNVHEVVQLKGRVGQSSISIDHFSHENIVGFINKIKSYAFLDAQTRTHSLFENTLQMICFPPAKFILNYLIKLGFLDGYRGLIYALCMSMHSLFVRVFYYEKLSAKNRKQ